MSYETTKVYSIMDMPKTARRALTDRIYNMNSCEYVSIYLYDTCNYYDVRQYRKHMKDNPESEFAVTNKKVAEGEEVKRYLIGENPLDDWLYANEAEVGELILIKNW